MAKNAGRRANAETKNNKASEKSKEQVKKRAVRELQKPSQEGSKREVLYQVKTKRDAEVIKAYIVNKGMKEISLKLGELTDDERTIITSGCLINYYRDH